MKTLLSSLFLLCLAPLALADARVDATAPAFEVKDATGKTHKLSDYNDKWLVLEWYNKDCPFVKKHYESGNMQKIQTAYTAKGVKWLSVISSVKDAQGYLEPAAAVANAKATGSGATAVLLDTDGKMGKAFGAKTTPHMFVINPKGVVVYAGAIDNNDSANPAVIASSKNYVVAALDAALTNKPIETKTSKPYGCSVKYTK